MERCARCGSALAAGASDCPICGLARDLGRPDAERGAPVSATAHAAAVGTRRPPVADVALADPYGPAAGASPSPSVAAGQARRSPPARRPSLFSSAAAGGSAWPELGPPPARVAGAGGTGAPPPPRQPAAPFGTRSPQAAPANPPASLAPRPAFRTAGPPVVRPGGFAPTPAPPGGPPPPPAIGRSGPSPAASGFGPPLSEWPGPAPTAAPPGPGGAAPLPPPPTGNPAVRRPAAGAPVLLVAGAVALFLLAVLATGAVLLTRRSAVTADDASRPRRGDAAPSLPVEPRPAPTAAPSSPSGSSPLTWTAWSPPDRSFIIEFPGKPQEQTPPGDDALIASAHAAQVITSQDLSHQIAWWDLRPNPALSFPDKVADALVDRFATVASMTFTGRTATTFAGKPATEFTGNARSEGRDIELEGVAVVVGNRAYLLAAAAGVGHPNEYPHFRDSFRIITGP
jgi:hypothetical protein